MPEPTEGTAEDASARPPAGGGPVEYSFGRRPVTPEERCHLIRAMFDRIAGRYDLMNDLMSLGIHRWWKAVLVNMVVRRRAVSVLDLAAGTGDVAVRIRRRRPESRLAVCDSSPAMLDICARRLGTGVETTCAEAENLPYDTGSFDAVTLAFGLRNMTDIDACLGECLRVLRPGGSLFCLEFSTPVWWMRHAYAIHSRLAIPVLGWAVAGDRQAYAYLVDSIRGFPDQTTLADRLRRIGYQDVDFHNLTGGIAAIHSACKPCQEPS